MAGLGNGWENGDNGGQKVTSGGGTGGRILNASN